VPGCCGLSAHIRRNMKPQLQPWQLLFVMFAGWVNRRRQDAIFFGESTLQSATTSFLNHDHVQRNHQGLANGLHRGRSRSHGRHRRVPRTTGRAAAVLLPGSGLTLDDTSRRLLCRVSSRCVQRSAQSPGTDGRNRDCACVPTETWACPSYISLDRVLSSQLHTSRSSPLGRSR